MTLNGCSYRIVSGYLTIRDIRILFNGIWIYLDHPHQLSVSTRCQNGHYPVNPDCAGANRIHALPSVLRLAHGASGLHKAGSSRVRFETFYICKLSIGVGERCVLSGVRTRTRTLVCL